MKRTLLFLFAFVAAMTTFAQDNLALKKTATASSGVASAAVDGDKGTRWESAATDTEWWQVDLGTAQEFNTIKILWEGAYTKSFTVSVSDDGETFTPALTVTDHTPTISQTTYQVYKLNDTAKGRYVKFQVVERGTPWGNSFWEFEIYNIDYSAQTLTTLTLAPAQKASNVDVGIARVGEAAALTLSALDQNGMDYDTSSATYEVTIGEGNVVDGKFTPTKAGEAEVTVTLEGKTAACKFYVIGGENIANGKLSDKSGEASDAFAAAMALDGNEGTRWGSGVPATAVGNVYDAWITADLGAYYTIDLVYLHQEQANSKNYKIQFAKNGTDDWTDAYSRNNVPGLAGDVRDLFFDNDTDNKDVRFVRFYSTEAASEYGVSVFELQVYGEKTAEIEDEEAPTDFTATLKETDYTSVTLTLKATDNESGITYVISRTGAEDVTASGASGEEITKEITGLTQGTEYIFSVVAQDAKGNKTDATTVTATTKALAKPEAAPAPDVDETKVKAVYSDKYTTLTNVTFNNWAGTAKGEGEAELATGDNARYVIALGNIYGIDLGERIDVSEFDKLHLDIWSENAQTIKVSPIWGQTKDAPKDVALNANAWTQVDLALDDFTGIDKADVYQIELVDGDGKSVIYIDNIYFYKEEATEVITALTATPADETIEVGKTTKLTVKDQLNKTVAADKVNFASQTEGVATVSTEGVVTGVAAGDAVITVTLKDNAEVMTKVNITVKAGEELPEAAETPEAAAADVLAIYSDKYGATVNLSDIGSGNKGSVSDAGWNVGYGTVEEKTLATGDNAIKVTDAVCFGVQTGGADVSDYDFLNVAIYSSIDFEGYIDFEGTDMRGANVLPISLKANQWNYVKATLTGNRTAGTWIQMYVGAADNKNTVYIDNIYFNKPAAGELIISEPNAQNVVTVKGELTNDNKDDVEKVEAPIVDLSGVTIASDVTTITTANPNAFIVVAGTVTGTDVTSDVADQLTGTKNLIVKRTDGYYFPVAKLEITDDGESPVWTDFFVSTNTVGYSYKRTIAAGEYTTAYLPAATTAAVDGLTVYTFKEYDATEKTVAFDKVDSGIIPALTPVLLHNTTSADVTITAEGASDLDFRSSAAGKVESNGVAFTGNYKVEAITDQYVPAAPTGSGAKALRAPSATGVEPSLTAGSGNTAPFRAYFTGLTEDTETSLSDVINGISIITADDAAANGTVYDLSGRKVIGKAQKGIYIINGNKVVIK